MERLRRRTRSLPGHSHPSQRLYRPPARLGSKIGFDATNKWPGETSREWGRPIAMSTTVKQRVDKLWGCGESWGCKGAETTGGIFFSGAAVWRR
jgi:hypothetical protein